MSDRIEEMEVKLAYLEDYLAQMDAVVRGLADQVVRLERDLAALAATSQNGGEGSTSSGGHEPPPHY